MGNQKSEQKKEFDIELNHPRFSKSKIVTQGEQKRLQTSFAIDEKEYDKWKLSTGKYATPPSNLLLPLDSSFSRTGMCGHTGNATVDYQNYPYLLTEEIYNRRGKKTRFSEVEVWYLLWGLTKGRIQAQQLGQQLGDIRPRNVFLNQTGSIKVSNSLSWPNEISNIQKAMDKIPTYLAPEDMERLSRNEVFDGPTDQAQAFSIGLTVLSVGNLCDYEDLYDLKNNSFDVMHFNQALGMWRVNNSYSEVLRGTVEALCQLNIDRRMTCGELNGLLEKHQESIERRVNFLIDNAPDKLHQQIMQTRQILGLVMPAPPAQPMVMAPQLAQNASIQPEVTESAIEGNPNNNSPE